VTKYTAQLGKVLRIIRSFSFFRILRYSINEEEDAVDEIEQKMLEDEPAGEAAGDKMKLGTQMSHVLIRRVIFGGVLAIAIIPIFTYSETNTSFKFVVHAIESLADRASLGTFVQSLQDNFKDILFIELGNQTLLDRRLSYPNLRAEDQADYVGPYTSLLVSCRRAVKKQTTDGTFLTLGVVAVFTILLYLVIKTSIT